MSLRLGKYVSLLLLAVCGSASSAGGCSRDVLVGRQEFAAVDGGGGASSGDGGSGGASSGACVKVDCAKWNYDCGDCFDNDGDGLVDMDDPDCVGPCQDTEVSFFGSIPGQNHAACTEDCYFDQDSGSGNDACNWSHKCDPLEVAPAFAPAGAECAYDPNSIPQQGTCETLAQQPDTCRAVCGPLTPNGCDCFGCCQIPGVPTPVYLGSVDAQGLPSCDADHVSDPARCKPCTQVTDCLNPCDRCELCVGKRTVPADCPDSGECRVPECAEGAPCGTPCLPPCPGGQACITGCCIEAPR